MKTSLSHLPESKQEEIAEILEIIREEANPEKVILFGSHARGNWVEDHYIEDRARYSYISDYDFLVVTNNSDQEEFDVVSRITNRWKVLSQVVSPIVHDIAYINEGLRTSQYFFTDIVNEGILLFDTGNFEFSEAAVLTSAEEKQIAQSYYDLWFPQALEFLDGANYHYSKNHLKVGVFSLHQATESFYSAALLVDTGYKPKSHNLANLRNYAKHISSELYQIFLTPSDDPHEKHLFKLLKRAYVDARYKKDYVITEEELKELIEKVTRMRDIVKVICQEKIDSFIVN